MKYLPRIAASGNDIEKYAHILISCARAEDATGQFVQEGKTKRILKLGCSHGIRAKNHDFSLGYGQYKSLLGQIYPQSIASSYYEGVEKPSPFPDSDVLGRIA